MTTHDRPAGIPSGYGLMRGSYDGTTDDRADRWYIVDNDADTIDKRGHGFRTRAEAWAVLRERVGPQCPACGFHDLIGLDDCGRCGWTRDRDPLANLR